MAIGNRIAPPRFLLFLGLFAIAAPLAARLLDDWPRGALLGFDLAAAVFLAAAATLLRSSGAAEMRRHARDNDANRALMLAITGAVMLTVLVAVALETRQRHESGNATILLIVATLLLAWLFSNSIYALHYAHMFYSGESRGEGGSDCGGLDFPGGAEPKYWDFVYFAFTLGMTFQTSDVALTDMRFRRVVTFHSLAAFVFNIGVLAFTINVLGGG